LEAALVRANLILGTAGHIEHGGKPRSGAQRGEAERSQNSGLDVS
jgi:hypothetical protein